MTNIPDPDVYPQRDAHQHHEHWWSGWPGCWCLKCGAEDPDELAMADDEIVFEDDGKETTGWHYSSPEVEARVKAALVCPVSDDQWREHLRKLREAEDPRR